jgi:hypothetical protein
VKKIIDEHGRVFGKISVIDFAVVLIVILIGAALYLKYDVLDVSDKTSQSGAITYTVTIYGVRDYTVDAVKPGDLLYDKNNRGGYPIGTITGIQTADAKKASELLDGTIVLGNKVGYQDITLTVTADCTRSDGKYLVNRTYELNANSKRTFNTRYCTFEATITAVDTTAGIA